jgi:hypothetical protein
VREIMTADSAPDEGCIQKMGNAELELVPQRFLWRFEMELTVFCLFAALNAAQNTTQHLPVTDAEKIADALRAGPSFITDHATILDWPAKKGGEFRVLRKSSSEWTCLPGPPPGATHDEPGCFDKVFFQWATGGLAGRPQHIERLGVAYMYTGAGFPTGPAKRKQNFMWAPTSWSSLRIRRNCRVSAAMGRTART